MKARERPFLDCEVVSPGEARRPHPQAGAGDTGNLGIVNGSSNQQLLEGRGNTGVINGKDNNLPRAGQFLIGARDTASMSGTGNGQEAIGTGNTTAAAIRAPRGRPVLKCPSPLW